MREFGPLSRRASVVVRGRPYDLAEWRHEAEARFSIFLHQVKKPSFAVSL